MPFDPNPSGVPWEPVGPVCKACRRPIARHEPTDELRFNPHPEHKLEEMNGLYHKACAKPFRGLASALDLLQRWSR